MKKKIFNLNLKNPKDWVLSKIICNQCNQNPDFEIIEFVNGQKWTYKKMYSLSLKASYHINKL